MPTARSVIVFYFMLRRLPPSLLFFFNDTATTEIYTLSLHDALPISIFDAGHIPPHDQMIKQGLDWQDRYPGTGDRKTTRLNSSHSQISYAVFCLKKKKKQHLVQAIHDKNETAAETPL